MKLGYTIVYVPDVAASLAFFEQAFGLSRRFLHESGDYGELDTGATTLAFASLALGNSHFAGGVLAASESTKPLGMEIALVTDDVASAHARAVAAGAVALKAPEAKPWGKPCRMYAAPMAPWWSCARRLASDRRRYSARLRLTIKLRGSPGMFHAAL